MTILFLALDASINLIPPLNSIREFVENSYGKHRTRRVTLENIERGGYIDLYDSKLF